MKPRTFKAASTQLALEQVQNELGSNAIILSVRQVPVGPAWQTWKRPEVEVLAVATSSGLENLENYQKNHGSGQFDTFGDEDIDVNPSIPRMPREHRNESGSSAMTSKKELESYLAQLTTRIAQVNAASKNSPTIEQDEAILSGKERKPETERANVPVTIVNIKNHLEQQGLDREIIKRVLTTCSESHSQNAYQDEERLRNHILHQLAAFTKKTRLDLLKVAQSRRIFYIVGSSGAGKTSTCAKIAAHYRKALSQKVSWISADTVRTGAIQLARSYTDSLGLPLLLVYTPDELVNAVRLEESADLVLVDMPACNPYNKQEVIQLGEFLTAMPERETYLTLPANTKEVDMDEALAALSPFNLTGLIFTKLDETSYFGSIYNIAWRSQIPVSAFIDGTDVVNNLHPASTKALASIIFGVGPGQ